MKNEYVDSVVEWLPLKNGKIMVNQKVEKLLTMESIEKNYFSNISPRFFILSHSERLMNHVLLALDGFKNNEINIWR